MTKTDTKIFINVSTAQVQAAAPLYAHDSEFRPLPAVVLLDTLDPELRFGTCSDYSAIPSAKHSDGKIGWTMPPLTRGSYLVRLAERLRPLMQRLLDDCSHETRDGKICTIMGEDAQAVYAEIGILLEPGGIIDLSDPDQTASLMTVGDFVDAPPDGLTAKTTDTEIEALASDLEDDADADGIALEGSMSELLTEMRDQLRNEAEDAA
jgi:hypothetical protein